MQSPEVQSRALRDSLLVVLEGIDGVGKSTFMRALPEQLRVRGWSDIVVIDEFPAEYMDGGMRDNIATNRGMKLHQSIEDPITQTFQFVGALTHKANMVRRIRQERPQSIVLVERWSHTTRVFQGRILEEAGIQPPSGTVKEWLANVISIVDEPDLIVYLNIPGWGQIENRLKLRSQHVNEAEKDFFTNVLLGYDEDFAQRTRELCPKSLNCIREREGPTVTARKCTDLIRVDSSGELHENVATAAEALHRYLCARSVG